MYKHQGSRHVQLGKAPHWQKEFKMENIIPKSCPQICLSPSEFAFKMHLRVITALFVTVTITLSQSLQYVGYRVLVFHVVRRSGTVECRLFVFQKAQTPKNEKQKQTCCGFEESLHPYLFDFFFSVDFCWWSVLGIVKVSRYTGKCGIEVK